MRTPLQDVETRVFFKNDLRADVFDMRIPSISHAMKIGFGRPHDTQHS